MCETGITRRRAAVKEKDGTRVSFAGIPRNDPPRRFLSRINHRHLQIHVHYRPKIWNL